MSIFSIIRIRLIGLASILLLLVSCVATSPAVASSQGVRSENLQDTRSSEVQSAKTKTKTGKLTCKKNEQVRIYSLTQGTTTVHQFSSRGETTNDRFENNSMKPVEHQTFTGEHSAKWSIIVTPLMNRANLYGGAACYPN